MSLFEAPAKVNLSLHVGPPTADGYHPITSLVQTIEWCDLLEVDEAESEEMSVIGADLDPEDNLVRKAVEAVRLRGAVPPLNLRLRKRIPVESGFGGGSSDAAAALLAAFSFGADDRMGTDEIAASLGADVPLFLQGGTILVSGHGEIVAPQPALAGLAVAVAVPEFSLSTQEVYRRWDEMEGPVGELTAPEALPPALRGGMPIRNDLTPAALDLEPALGDFMADLRSVWGIALMTGSGSGCFGLFPDRDEADDAAVAVRKWSRVAVGADLRGHGARRADD